MAQRRDSRGRFLPPTPTQEESDTETAPETHNEEADTFGTTSRGRGMVSIETGRGNAVSVPAGAPFRATVDRVADQANYGGYFRVFLNGVEILEPSDAPPTVQEGMRISLCPYDKVG